MAPTTTTLVVYLPVTDVKASVVFYTKVLGFSLVEESLAPEGFAHLWYGGHSQKASGAQIMLRKWPEEPHSGTSRDEGETKPATYDIMFHVEEEGKGKEVVDDLFAKIERGAGVVEVPEDKPWGCRQFTLKDPDGHRVTFFADLKRN